MPAVKGESITYYLLMRRLFWLPLGLFTILALAVLAALVAMSWRSLDRLQPVQNHLVHIARIQNLELNIEQTLLKGLRGTRVDPTEVEQLRNKVREIASLQGALHPYTRRGLTLIAEQLTEPRLDPLEILFEALAEVRQILAGERERHNRLLLDVTRDAETELRLSVVLLVVLPLGGSTAMYVLQRRVEQPLKDLEELLKRLAARDYQPVPVRVLKSIDKLAQPAFYNYNALVMRLQELEIEHRDREHTLEHKVRKATEALLAQSRELARAERLAAVGAISAGLAHELRNPLAGIQMACTKLHRTLNDGEHAARIASVVTELKRVNNLLTEQLDAAYHAPEPLAVISVGSLVNELLALIRYQIPEGITLEAQVPEDLNCLLPAAELRQALLNLVLNAVQVLGDTGHVTVAGVRQDSRVAISVIDDGSGFPEEMLRAGIRPFATGRAGGTGLGLAMVRRFVRDHDGELELTNRQPHGAQVSLRLSCKVASTLGNEIDV